MTKQPLNIFQLQREIKIKYQEEKLFGRINSQSYIFDINMVNLTELVLEYLNNKYILTYQSEVS